MVEWEGQMGWELSSRIKFENVRVSGKLWKLAKSRQGAASSFVGVFFIKGVKNKFKLVEKI